MLKRIAWLYLLAVVSAVPQRFDDNTPIPILRSVAESNLEGGYSFSFETANEIQREEVGELKTDVTGKEVQAVRGYYSYRDPEGYPVVVTYTADENGFQAQGAHLPTPPPIPEAIAVALARNAAEESRLSDQERAIIATGQYVWRQK